MRLKVNKPPRVGYYAGNKKAGEKMTIKELRTAAKMTQKAFAEYFNIPKRTIEEWEAERRKPPQYLIELIEYKLKNEKLIKKDGVKNEQS